MWLEEIDDWVKNCTLIFTDQAKFKELSCKVRKGPAAQKAILKVEMGQLMILLKNKIWKRCFTAEELVDAIFEAHGTSHASWGATVEVVQKLGYSLYMHEVTKVIIQSCDICKRFGKRVKEIIGQMSQFQELRPFAHVSMDFIGPMPCTEAGNRFILLIVDHMTQYAIAGVSGSDGRGVSKVWISG